MSLSIRQYAFLFSIITLMLITGFSYKTNTEFEETKSQIQKSQEDAATNELVNAIGQTLLKLNNAHEKLINWEELQQQIHDTKYFTYWYNNRLKKAQSEVPEYIDDLMLYDNHGKALANLANSELPNQLDKFPVSTDYLVINKNELILALPVYDKDSNKVIGFISTKLNFIDLIKSQTNFYYIDPDSLSFKAKINHSNHTIIDEEQLSFKVIKTPEILQLEDQLHSSINQLILLVIFPTLLLYGTLVYIITVPINGFSNYLHRLSNDPEYKGTFNYKALLEVKELNQIFLSLREYHSELFDSHAVLDEKNKALWEQANHDALTGAYNRRAFDNQWKNLNDLLSDHRVNVSFMLFDVNLFKSINDTYGHQVGDHVLIGIAECLMKSLRKGEHLFRLGGDEFATFLIDSNINISIDVANRCLKTISEYSFDKLGMPEPVRISIGISQSDRDDEESFNNLQWQADTAMYEAKRPGNDDAVVFTEAITDNSQGLLSSWLNNTVYQAIDKGIGIVLHYQPIIDFQQNKISYFEALIRINAEGELISPASIFNIVEARRFEIDLDRAVIKKLVEDLSAGKIPEGTGVSLNLSGPTLTKPMVTDWLIPLQPFVKKYKIVIEITETALITELKRVTKHLKVMQKMGYTIALDDFGSGYSSVKYLSSMPVDVVKFDITLVQTLLDPKQRRMITRLAQMIEEAGHKLVAEGIEDQELLHLVLQSGFHFGQGYLFGKPQEKPIEQYSLEEHVFDHHLAYRQLSLH